MVHYYRIKLTMKFRVCDRGQESWPQTTKRQWNRNMENYVCSKMEGWNMTKMEKNVLTAPFFSLYCFYYSQFENFLFPNYSQEIHQKDRSLGTSQEQYCTHISCYMFAHTGPGPPWNIIKGAQCTLKQCLYSTVGPGPFSRNVFTCTVGSGTPAAILAPWSRCNFCTVGSKPSASMFVQWALDLFFFVVTTEQ